MSRFFPSSLRRAALVVVLAAALPPFGIIIAAGVNSYGDAEEDMRDRNFRSVQSVAGRIESGVENVRNVLLALSQTSEVRSADPVSSSRLFRDISAESPAVAGIFMTALDGTVLSSSLRGKTNYSLAGRDFILQMEENQDFAVSNLPSASFGTTPIVQFGLPLYDRQDNIYAYIGAALQVQLFSRLLAEESTPKNSVFYLLDGKGSLIAFAAKNPLLQERRSVSGEIRLHLQGSMENADHFEHTGVLSGEEYLISFQKLVLREGGGSRRPFMYVVLATPKQTIYERSADLLQRNALLMGLAALCAAIAARYLTDLGFTRSVDILLRAASRMRAGDFSRHSEEKSLYGEFAALGEEFNAMAATVEKRNRDLAEARDAAAAGSKAKTEFLANMSHEIRTPMNAVTGMSYLALKTGLTPLQHNNVTKILESSNTLLRIINDILDLSKIESGNLTLEHAAFRFDHVFGTFLNELQEIAQKRNITIVPHIDSDIPPRFKGDPLRLTQALNIIMAEAMEYCRDTAIELNCAAGRGEHSMVTLQFSLHLPGVLLPEAALEKFRRYLFGNGVLPAAVSGTSSLRLALARRILQVFGGTVTVLNTPRSGAVFSITIHLYAAANAFAEQETPFIDARALVVDEQDASRVLLARTLQAQGLRTVQLGSLNDLVKTLAAAEKKREPFDFVVFDLPSGTARISSFISRVKHDSGIRRQPAFILATSHSLSEAPAELYRAGLDALLPKPINTAFLADTLTGLIQARAGSDLAASCGGAS